MVFEGESIYAVALGLWLFVDTQPVSEINRNDIATIISSLSFIIGLHLFHSASPEGFSMPIIQFGEATAQ